ncbi:MAG: VCBS repeat-containing protein [Bacteroidetes bacterium]|nr:VCBS repeat-containing protein [Bacteroidota bacterium]
MPNKRVLWAILVGALSFVLGSCRFPQQEEPVPTLFTLLTPEKTNVNFVNQLTFTNEFNIFKYRNFYNGGGVALGDINNDGLIDLYLTANMTANKLFLNKGNFVFEDITEQAGVGGSRAWSTGVSMADVNGDGWLDIYVCNSGELKGDNKQNELFINNGDLTFSENAEAYGLADRGYSTHAAFFDYDKDGDLDVYLLNNSFQAIGSFNLKKNERPKRDPVAGDKLFRNDTPTEGKPLFTDVSEAAGIYGSVIGFGLGVTVGDLNKDGWLDIYVSNDFFERDYIYMNNGDGTFTEDLEKQMRSISAASMGADMADINNDGRADIFVTEMLPEKEDRIKTVTTFENWDRYQYNVRNDYHHQFTRNMLHINNADGTFSEIGRMAGVHATDWSWAALIADFDNDGFKDIFVANGIHQDLTNQDYLQFISNEETIKAIITKSGVDYKALVDAIPSNRIPNYAFKNNGGSDRGQAGYSFTNITGNWGLDTPSHSNGSAYGDLDNDGDLDLVVNNVNMPLFMYRNELDKIHPQHRFLKIILIGKAPNTYAIGTKLTIKHKGATYYLEQMPVRGFQSTIDFRPNFGLGKLVQVDSLIVEWPTGLMSVLRDIKTDQTLTIDENKIEFIEWAPESLQYQKSTIFTEITEELNLPYVHKENHFVDFDRDRLLFHMISTEGPGICLGDVNNDHKEDIFIGGAKGFSGELYLQMANGKFGKTSQPALVRDKISEDTDCTFFDADNDGDLDLYVASGGTEFSSSSSALSDRLYINDGRGNFTKSPQALPTGQFESSATVEAADFDGDGDIDLFVGVRAIPFRYGLPVNGYILENNGEGDFSNVTKQLAPGLLEVGLIKDAIWEDINKDNRPDLIVVGEWMPIKVFINISRQGQISFQDITESAGLGETNGWWNSIQSGDFDNDGDTDFIVGNHGLNSRFKASFKKPISIYINDYDRNGTIEQIITTFNGDTAYPLALRHDLVMQMPHLKKKYLKYESFKGQTINDIFPSEKLQNSVIHQAYNLETSMLINNGDGTFEIKGLPLKAQLSPTFGVLLGDFDSDGNQDILLGGNLHNTKPEVGRYDASYGLFLKGDGKNNFVPISAQKSGFLLDGEVRNIVGLSTTYQNLILVVKNDDPMQVFQY